LETDINFVPHEGCTHADFLTQALNAENRARELANKFADSERATTRKNEIYESQKQLLEKEKLVCPIFLDAEPLTSVNVLVY